MARDSPVRDRASLFAGNISSNKTRCPSSTPTTKDDAHSFSLFKLACYLALAIAIVWVFLTTTDEAMHPFAYLNPGYKRYNKTISVSMKRITGKSKSYVDKDDTQIMSSAAGGHWEYHASPFQDNSPPYNFSQHVCEATYLSEGDCNKAKACPTDLMNWVYIGNDNKPFPRFDVIGFQNKMRNSRIAFIGSSMMRQQVTALVWTLGFKEIKWKRIKAKDGCTAPRNCVHHDGNNITICYQFLGFMATKVYHEGNYTLDLPLGGHGDSSCLLDDEMIADLNTFDVTFVQSLVWWTNLGKRLNSTISPFEWVTKMLPTVYNDAMLTLLSKISQQTKTVFVLGQTGANCLNRTTPEPFSLDQIRKTKTYGWNLSSKLWNTSLSMIQEEGLDVQVVDSREPLMQSVHSHPWPDCLHFCMNSAAINIYLDMYWNEVFSQHMM